MPVSRRLTCALISALLGVAATSQAATPGDLELVASWNTLPFAFPNAAVAKTFTDANYGRSTMLHGLKLDSKGNIYVSTARWADGVPATLSKLVRQGDGYVLEPFPNWAANQAGQASAFQSVLGFEIDRNDVMWVLDQGHINSRPSQPGAEKLVLIDLNTGRELQRFVFDDALSNKKCSFLNDIVVDNDSDTAYITDSGIFCDPLEGGLLVYDRKTNTARRVLHQSPFTQDEAGFVFRIDNVPVLKGSPMRTGADGIALSGDKATLYWTNLTGNTLYSLPTALLRDPRISEARLRTNVNIVSKLPSNTDGMTSDTQGNLYLTALQLGGIMKRDVGTGRVSPFALHPQVSWPDTVAWGPDGWLYFTSNHLNQFVDGTMNFNTPATPNFQIWRVFTGTGSYTQPR